MRSLKVFVSDDDRPSRILARDLLSMRGHEVVEHDGGAGVIAAIALARPDVILLDLHVRDKNALNVARAIKADPDLGRLQMVAYTARAMADEVAEIRAAGFDAYIRKPISIHHFISAIESLGERMVRSEDEGFEHLVVLGGRCDRREVPVGGGL